MVPSYHPFYPRNPSSDKPSMFPYVSYVFQLQPILIILASMKNLLFITFLFFTLQSLSQSTDSGYVITNNHDTLYGTFRDDILSKKIKIYINGELKKFDVTELLGYKKGDEINKRFSNDLYMATLEKPGKISIWVIEVNGQYGFIQYFLEKDGVGVELTTYNWNTFIADWLKDYDCDSELFKKKLTIKKFKKIIEAYNSCLK